MTFTVTLNPSDGLGNTIGVLIGARMLGRGSCYVAYDRGEDSFSLMNDAGDHFEPRPPNAGMENKQCMVAGSGTAAEIGEHVLTLRLPITFKPGFAGPKNIYVCRDVEEEGRFQRAGTWMVAP